VTKFGLPGSYPKVQYFESTFLHHEGLGHQKEGEEKGRKMKKHKKDEQVAGRSYMLMKLQLKGHKDCLPKSLVLGFLHRERG
jgi:hypothetical protein